MAWWSSGTLQLLRMINNLAVAGFLYESCVSLFLLLLFTLCSSLVFLLPLYLWVTTIPSKGKCSCYSSMVSSGDSGILEGRQILISLALFKGQTSLSIFLCAFPLSPPLRLHSLPSYLLLTSPIPLPSPFLPTVSTPPPCPFCPLPLL